ncbi:MAG: branched-chain amino acid ABC transporter substrate-binding protein [Actinobacteria bacterium]|nr:branched-chain amino acid ABC transporter substrate-binding protein [Actinomycetota bacterium]
MRGRGGVVLALATMVAAALASTAGAGSSTVARTQAVNCKGQLRIGIITPLTGGAGFLGQEQLSWTRFAVARLAKGLGLNVRVVLGDTPVEKGAGEGLVVAQKMISDARLVAVIGPATSGAVASASKALFAAGIAHISPSATRTSLTQGSTKEATAAFFRVVPGDYIQGPTDANYMVDKLNAKKVVLIDFQEPYSVGLADAAEAVLKRRGVTTIRQSTSVNTTDFSSLVTRVPSDAEIVFFPTQQPADAQTFGQQLLEQGKRAKVFGGDGANNAQQFKLNGSYVSNFAPDISGIASSKALIDGWKRANPSATLGSFGPPAYLATQVALNAIKRACDAGKGTMKTRRDVVRQVKKVRVPISILGGAFRFSTKSNDPLNARFYIFQIQSNGTYKLVG